MNTKTKVLFVLFATAALLGTGCNKHGKKLEFNGCELFYKKPITKAKATELGNYLVKEKFFQGTHKISAQIRKPDGRLQFRFVVKDGFENKAEYHAIVKKFAIMISQNVFGGEPLDVHLCDNKLKTKVVIPWEDAKKDNPRMFKNKNAKKAPAKTAPAKKAPAKKAK